MSRVLNGTTDRLHQPDITLPSSGAIAGWVKIANLPPGGTHDAIWSLCDISGSEPYTNHNAGLYITSGGIPKGIMYDGSSRVATHSDALTTGAWHHVGISWGTHAGGVVHLRVWLNGNAVAATCGTPTVAMSDQGFVIGPSLSNFFVGGSMARMDGKIADVAIWSRTLTDAEWMQLATAVKPDALADTSGLISLAYFDGDLDDEYNATDYTATGTTEDTADDPDPTEGPLRIAATRLEALDQVPVAPLRIAAHRLEALDQTTAALRIAATRLEVLEKVPAAPVEPTADNPPVDVDSIFVPHWYRVNAIGNVAINASTVRYAWVFRAPKAGTLNRAGFRFASAATPQTMKASFQNANASVMRPDETVDQFRTFTPATGWISTGLITSDGTDGGTKRTVTKGELLCLVVEWDAATGAVVLQPHCGANDHWKPNIWHAQRSSGGAWSAAINLSTANFGVQYDDGNWAYIDGAVPFSNDSNHAFNSGSTPDEIGLRFVAPWDGAKLKGVFAYLNFAGGFEIHLYDAADALVASSAIASTNDRAGAFALDCYAELPNHELEGGQVYRVTLIPTSANNVTLQYIDVPTNDYLRAWPMGHTCYQTARTNGVGPWVDTDTRRPALALIFADQFEEEPPIPPEPPSDRPVAILEMCFGKAPSGKPGYRNWIKEHPSVIAHWFLSDVGPTGAEDAIYPNDAGIYNGDPVKGRGLLPEFGLSTTFDGVDDFVEVDYDFFGLGSNAPFTFCALVRPFDVTSAAARCVHMSGTTGGYLGIDTAGRFTFGANGGTKVTLTELVEAGGEYLAVGTYDGTDANLRVYALHTQRAAQPEKLGELLGVAGPTAISIGPHGGSDAFIGKGGSLEFIGDIQGVACIGAALDLTEIGELLECCTWTDVSGDARASVPIETASGLFDDSPETRLAPVGVCTFALDNSHDNEGATEGWYSPDHGDVRDGFQRGIPVRASIGSELIGSFTRFIGSLAEIRPQTGRHSDRLTYCIAYDWMQEAAKFNLQGIETQENITADEVIELILMRMANKPHALSLATGSDTYPIALDNTEDERAYAQTEFGRLMMSELGLLFVTPDGALTFENRTTRAVLTTVAHTIDNGMSNADADASSDQIINRVRAIVHPRRVDAAATTVLYSSSNRLEIDGGELTTFLQFRDPAQEAKRFGGLDVNTPTPSTDYTFNTAADGSGLDVTAHPNVVVSFEISGSGVYMTTVNTYGQRLYLDIEITGKGVYDYEPVTVIETNDESIEAVGINEAVLDMPYQTSVPIGQGAAQQVLSVFQDTSTRMRSVELPVHKSATELLIATTVGISDRVTVREAMTGIDGDFFVNGIRLAWSQDKAITLLLFLTPADNAEYWILGQSELDITTRLGFA